MAKTDLTLRIEDRLYYYDPETTGGVRINKFRRHYIGYEVPVLTGTTSGGLVDCVRIDQTLIEGEKSRACSVGLHPDWYKKHNPNVINYIKCSKGYSEIDEFPEYCSCTECNTNTILKNYDNDICVTCYEIKISKTDFHSSHGHNFCGNANYYVMPQELYNEVKKEIPEDIGVIVYRCTDTTESLRRVKECTYKQLDAESHRWMLINVMKKLHCWKDMNLLEQAVERLHSLVPRSCTTCDFSGNCDHLNDCSVNTSDESHSSFWECQDNVLSTAGFLNKSRSPFDLDCEIHDI